MSGWHAPVAVLAGTALAALLFLYAFARLRMRAGAHAPWQRAMLFATGLAAIVLPLVSPLDGAAEDRLYAHMLQHVLIGDVAPLLLALALSGPLALFLLPPVVLKPLASFRPLRRFLGVVLQPRVSFALWGVALLTWHIPAAYDAAVRHPAVHVVEHACFIAAGFLAWTQLIDPLRHGRLSRAGKITFAFGLFAVTQPLMSVLLFATSPVYDPYADVSDQRLAAIVMLVEQLVVYGSFIALQLRPLLKARRGRAAVEGSL